MDSSIEKLYAERFQELKPPLRPEEALVESERCLYCYDAPCIVACPTHIDIPRFIKQIASENLTGSAKTILEANALGHSCARACPVEVLCEGACVFHEWQEKPIEIARLQRRATDDMRDSGREPFKPGAPNGKKVAIVGSGPAGLACAMYLRRLGFAVTVFERDSVAGGLNTLGIAEYKMRSQDSLDEIDRILKLGVDLKLNTEVGKDVKTDSLLKQFDAVFIGIGLGDTNMMRIPGEDLPGVWDALSFIRFVKERDLKPLGKSACTIVVGAGNTSIDAVTQSKRTGAKKVVMAYRRSEEEMGAYGFEYDLAKGDGAEFLWNAAPVKVLGAKKVEGMEFIRTETKDGKLVSIKGSEFTVPCDRVIKAIGQQKQLSLAKALGLKLKEDGRIEVSPDTLRSSESKIFAGGDAINGGKEVVNAAADGKRAAYGIWRALFPGQALPAGSMYWVSTIDIRRVAPIPDRNAASAHRPEISANGKNLKHNKKTKGDTAHA
jgi:glutamate synthase (NADPH/NADH) small chain